jgi:hypothetical protein
LLTPCVFLSLSPPELSIRYLFLSVVVPPCLSAVLSVSLLSSFSSNPSLFFLLSLLSFSSSFFPFRFLPSHYQLPFLPSSLRSVSFSSFSPFSFTHPPPPSASLITHHCCSISTQSLHHFFLHIIIHSTLIFT